MFEGTTTDDLIRHYVAVRKRLVNGPTPVAAPEKPHQAPPKPEWHTPRFVQIAPWLHVDDVIADALNSLRGTHITTYTAMRAFVRASGQSEELFRSARRTQPLVSYRGAAMATAYLLGKKQSVENGPIAVSYPDVGRRFGGRDHTTVISAVRKWGERVMKEWNAL